MRLAKLRRIFRSDLSLPSRFRFVVDEIRDRLGLYALPLRNYRLTGGAKIYLRWGSTDSKVFDEVFLEKIYEPLAAAIPPDSMPDVLVDLGANIGLSSLFLCRMLGISHVVAVEPDRANLRTLRTNLEPNVSAEVTSIQAFAGAERGFANMHDAGYGSWGLRMGERADHGIPVLPMREILPHTPEGVLLKCDIEGAEQLIFPDIAEWEEWVSFIILELHTEFFTANQLLDALAKSRYEWHLHGVVAEGAVLAVLALERGALRVESTPGRSRGAAAMGQT
jgi:FkbM family methyltransferase